MIYRLILNYLRMKAFQSLLKKAVKKNYIPKKHLKTLSVIEYALELLSLHKQRKKESTRKPFK